MTIIFVSRWTLLHGCSFDPDNTSFPTGRSWHTLTLVDDYHALLYGGYDHHGSPRGDCWLADLSPGGGSSASQRWTRLHHLEKGDLLWHSAATLPIGQVYLVKEEPFKQAKLLLKKYKNLIFFITITGT